MFNKGWLILLTLFFAADTVAQKNPGKYPSLLWRISGNGLTKPSYLFGTMHLTDKKLFYFSDSLYHALETAEGFAAELDLQESMPSIMQEVNSERSNQKKLVELLSGEELKPFQKKLESVMKMRLAEIRMKDLHSKKSEYYSKIVKKGEMPAIIDLYLFDIAENKGKWVGGIEDPEDQLQTKSPQDEARGLIAEILSDPKEMKKMLNWMIDIYLSQDLDKIDRNNAIWKGSADSVLIRRNIKMARRMDSIMNIRSCLFAVGAAHLPGDSGVVTLLRSRGFKVEPIRSEKTIDPDSYTFVRKEKPWVSLTSDSSWYSILAPVKAVDMETELSADGSGLRAAPDLATGDIYFTIASELEDVPKDIDSALKNVSKKLSARGTVKSEKPITVGGLKGMEVIAVNDGQEFRMQYFLPMGRAAVMNFFSTRKSDSLFGTRANRFFNSFNVVKEVPKPLPGKWQASDYSPFGFLVNIPGRFSMEEVNEEDSVWKSYRFLLNPPGTTGITFWMLVQSTRTGYYINGDSSDFAKTELALNTNTDSKPLLSENITIDGYPGYLFRYHVEKGDENYELYGKLLHRGNRRLFYYAAYTQSDDHEMMAKRYVESFRLIPYPTQTWQRQSSPDGKFSLWAAQPLSSIRSDGKEIIYADDSVSVVTILIQKIGLGKYRRWDNDSIFFRTQASAFYNEKDSLIEFNFIKDGSSRSSRGVVDLYDNHNYLVFSSHLYGDTLYNFFGYMPPSSFRDTNYQRLFRDIKFIADKPVYDNMTSKASRLLSDLRSSDSSIRQEAAEGLLSYKFKTEDIPLLKEALLHSYPSADAVFNVYGKLTDKLVTLDDGSVLEWVKEQYNSVAQQHPENQYEFLKILPGLATKESYLALKEILLQRKWVPGGEITDLSAPLKDSIQLTSLLFPECLQLSKDSNQVKFVVELLPILLDSGFLQLNDILPYKKYYFSHVDKLLATLKQSENDDGFYMSAWSEINLLALLKEPEAIARLQKLSAVKQSYTAFYALRSLVDKKLPAESRVINRFAAEVEYRYSLYELLKKNKKLSLFPVKYLTRAAMAEAELAYYSDEDLPIEKVQYLQETTLKIGSELQKWVVSVVSYKNDDNQEEKYLGFTGPYKGKELITPDTGIVRVFFDQQYNGKNLQEIVNAFSKLLESEAEEESNDD